MQHSQLATADERAVLYRQAFETRTIWLIKVGDAFGITPADMVEHVRALGYDGAVEMMLELIAETFKQTTIH